MLFFLGWSYLCTLFLPCFSDLSLSLSFSLSVFVEFLLPIRLTFFLYLFASFSCFLLWICTTEFTLQAKRGFLGWFSYCWLFVFAHFPLFYVLHFLTRYKLKHNHIAGRDRACCSPPPPTFPIREISARRHEGYAKPFIAHFLACFLLVSCWVYNLHH